VVNVTQTSSFNHLHRTSPEKTLPKQINSRQHNSESLSPSGFSGPSRVPGRFNFTPSSQEAASDSACRRWTTDLMKIVAGDERLMAAVNDAMTSQMIADATEAELRKRGSGIILLLPKLQQALRGPGGSAR
jgi:hypothetical protein